MTENIHAVTPRRVVLVGLTPEIKERLLRSQGHTAQSVPDYFSNSPSSARSHSAPKPVEESNKDLGFLDQLGDLIRNVNKETGSPFTPLADFAAELENRARETSRSAHPSNAKTPVAPAPKSVPMHVDEVLAARTIAAANDRRFLSKHSHVESEIIRIGLAMNPNCDRYILENLASNEGLSATVASVRLKDLDHAEEGLRQSVADPDRVNDKGRWMDATGITVVRYMTGDSELVNATVGECLEKVREVVEAEIAAAAPKFEPKSRFNVVEVAPGEYEVHSPLAMLTVVDSEDAVPLPSSLIPGIPGITRMYKGGTYIQSEDVATIDDEKLVYRATDLGLSSLVRGTEAVLNGIVIDGNFWEKVNPLHTIY